MIRFAQHAVESPRTWLVGVAIVTLVFAAGLLRLELHTEGAALHPRSNELIERDQEDRRRFEEPRHVVLLVSCRTASACLTTPAGLAFLRDIHREAAQLPAVRTSGVESIAALVRIERGAGRLSMDGYLDDLPTDDPGVARLVAEIRRNPLSDGLLLSPDGRFAPLFLPLVENRPVRELVAEVEAWRGSRSHSAYELRLTGPLVAETTLGEMVLRDLVVLVPIMLAVIAVLLFLSFGSIGGVLIPMAESLLVLIWTFGAMGWLGVPVTLVTTILPVVLMVIAITDEIHLLERFRVHERTGSSADAVLAALEEVGRPIILTSITTTLGFLSFLSASMRPLHTFGVFTGFGILVAMALTFCWIPALIVSLPASWMRPVARRPFAAPGFGLGALASWAARRPGAAALVGAAALGLMLPGLALLRVQDSWVDNFDRDSALVTAERDFNAAFWGSYRFDIVLSGEPDFFYSSRGAALLERIVPLVGEAPYVGGVESLLMPLGEVARGLGELPPLSRLPEMAVSDLAALTEMADRRLGLRQLLTDAGDGARVRLYVKSPDYARGSELRAFLDRELPGVLERESVDAHYSGDLAVAMEVVEAIVVNQIRSIGWVLVSVTLALVLFFRSPTTGLVSMVPVAATTAALLGGMGWVGLPLGIATSMFASLVVGVGVDFGIHFLHRYRGERERGADDASALATTVSQTGAALRWNVVVLSLGFLTLTVSSLKPNHTLGLLLAVAMLACYLSTLLLLPRLARYSVSRSR